MRTLNCFVSHAYEITRRHAPETRGDDCWHARSSSNDMFSCANSLCDRPIEALCYQHDNCYCYFTDALSWFSHKAFRAPPACQFTRSLSSPNLSTRRRTISCFSNWNLASPANDCNCQHGHKNANLLYGSRTAFCRQYPHQACGVESNVLCIAGKMYTSAIMTQERPFSNHLPRTLLRSRTASGAFRNNWAFSVFRLHKEPKITNEGTVISSAVCVRRTDANDSMPPHSRNCGAGTIGKMLRKQLSDRRCNSVEPSFMTRRRRGTCCATAFRTAGEGDCDNVNRASMGTTCCAQCCPFRAVDSILATFVTSSLVSLDDPTSSLEAPWVPPSSSRRFVASSCTSSSSSIFEVQTADYHETTP